MKNHMNEKKKGFTLVELIAVLVILAVLTAILIPSFSEFISRAKQSEYLVKARSAVDAAQCVATEEYAKGASFDTWRGFTNITDRNAEIQNRIYELSGIDKNEFVIANVDVDASGQLIFVNFYSRKTFDGKPNRLVYINGTVGGQTYNGEFVFSCWNGMEYVEYKSLDPAQAGYQKG